MIAKKILAYQEKHFPFADGWSFVETNTQYVVVQSSFGNRFKIVLFNNKIITTSLTN